MQRCNGPRAGPGRILDGPGRAGLFICACKTGRARPGRDAGGPGRASGSRPVQTSGRNVSC